MMKKSAFTFVQALVVIFFLLIIATLLFPIFARPRRNTRKSSCQSNLKQISLAFKQYTQDYDERFPIIAIEPASSAARYGGPYGWADSIQPYLKSTYTYQCPSEVEQEEREYKSWEIGYSDYYMNAQLASVEENVWHSANTVLLADGNDGLDVNDARYAHPVTPPEWRGDKNSPLHRHLAGCNYAFVDGHVKWLKAELAPEASAPNSRTFTFRAK